MKSEINLDFSLNFIGVLTLMLIAFKITGYIDWSWWLVLSPLLFQFAISIVIILVLYVINI